MIYFLNCNKKTLTLTLVATNVTLSSNEIIEKLS